ncbi:aspartate aminotransferase [Nannocystis exedens]|uniref:Aminotransferase n=1 Tax=Nannocystis exedens TaxID=54 RepID=A0A1I2H488_9BACT|nr:aminotransferase class I/II-fold pyridoxal phosphate-dependent enzyme [Nannocystis exedens]PCC73984.1 aspartate aminotransferase [Nannocystis exedens]SFF24955.1 aspartate aminotransferase [Nannocystis exedens]
MKAIDAVEASATVAIADAAAARRADGEPVIDLSAGRAPEPTPSFIVEAAVAAMLAGHTHQAPARGVPSYLHVIAERLLRVHGLRVDPASEVMATAGCKQGLMLALLAVMERGAEVIVEDPCFVSYAPTISLLGGTPVRVAADPARRWCMKPEALAAAVGPKTRAVIVCSPHNPAGVVHTLADLEPLARLARRHDWIVIVDEVYESVTWGGRRHTPIASLPDLRERTIGLMSLTKSHAMGGWRIGYAYGPRGLVARMVKAQQHLSTCASSIAQHAASAALEAAGEARMTELWAAWERRVAGFTRDLAGLPGLRVEPVEAGFYAWVDVRETGLDGDEFCRRLLREEQVAAVPGSAFGPRSAGYVRFTTVKDEDELEAALGRIDRFVRGL